MGIKHHASRTNFRNSPNGSRCFYTDGPFASVAKVENCPCEDGKRRTAHATAEPDTFFSIPACVYVTGEGKSKTVSGFLSCDDVGWRFTVDQGGVNAALIPVPEPPADARISASIVGLEPDEEETR